MSSFASQNENENEMTDFDKGSFQKCFFLPELRPERGEGWAGWASLMKTIG